MYLAIPAVTGMGIVFQYDHQNHGVVHALFTMLVSGVIAAATLLGVLRVYDPARASSIIELVTDGRWSDHLP